MQATLNNGSRFKNGRRALAMAGAAACLYVGALPTAQAEGLVGKFSGAAHGILERQAGNDIEVLGLHSAAADCPCRGTGGKVRRNEVLTLDLGPLGSAGDNTASATGKKTATTAATKQSATVQSVSLFGGLITADAITATAAVDATADAFTTSSDGTKFVNLTIAGHRIRADVPDNTQLDLPGLGTVTVKSVQVRNNKRAADIKTNALLVNVTTANNFGLAVGAVLAVGNATAAYSRIQPAVSLSGYGLTARVQEPGGASNQAVVDVGAKIGLPGCAGTDGQTRTDATASVAIPGLGTVGAAKVSAFGGPEGDASVARTTSMVTKVSLLGGLVTADTLIAVAQESRTGKVSTGSTAGSRFAGLAIAGIKVPANTKPNTELQIPGVGKVTVNEQTITPHGDVQVNELDVVVTLSNTLGIPVGTRLVVGSARAAATAF